ncbi:hypothetical protein EON82_26545 [bacterium]|nr:MAG: hypothetical protein EON82_26545 [bacterium]
MDAFEERFPGEIAEIAQAMSRHADKLLEGKYATPFRTPYPVTLRYHVASLVLYRMHLREGVEPEAVDDDATSPNLVHQMIVQANDSAEAWLNQAAGCAA